MNKEALGTTEQIFKILIDDCKDEDFKQKLKVSLPNIIARETKLRYQLEQALTQEVSKDTNVEEVEEAIQSIEGAFDAPISLFLKRQFETIRNYINNVPKDVPNQSAKEIKPPLMVLKTNVGNCVVCDNEVTSEENYCSECGVQLKELQNE